MKSRHFGKAPENPMENAPEGSPDPQESAQAGGRAHHPRRTRVLCAVLVLAVLAAGLAVYRERLPALNAKADMVYDSGGRLSKTDVSAPADGFLDSYNGFGLNLLRRQYREGQNLFLSPASVYLALAMVRGGAKGDTAEGFSRVLGGTDGGTAAWNRNCLALQGLISGGRFRLANSIWLDGSFRSDVNADFLTADKTWFGASVGTLNFSSPEAGGVLNRWVRQNTGNRIDPGFKTFDARTVMAVLNTIYFKSNWAQKFDKKSTKDDVFHAPAGDKTVSFMTGGRSGYFENGLLQGILLPYDDNKTSMMILLPKTNLGDLLGRLTAADLAAYVKKNSGGDTEALLSLPRLKFRTSLKLDNTLKAMGLASAFDPNAADLSGIAGSKGSLYLSSVVHMTYLAVDENSTEAAAITGIFAAGSAGPPVAKTVMKVDRPFLVAIVNNETGAQLFLGAVADPSVSQ